MDADKPLRRVVIIGGGFAGLYAARALRRAPVSVILVDRAAHHLFQPLLYQCATGILSEGQIASPLREVLRRHHNVETLLAEVVDVDPVRRLVIALRPGGSRLEIPYDDLVVTAGVRQSYFGHDEFAAHAPGMKTIGDALAIRQRVFGAFEMAETAATVEERRRYLTFALVGAGPTGVELAGQIRELATHTLRKEFHRSTPEDARVLLFNGGPDPLASFGPTLSTRAAAALTHLGVELHMNSLVTNVDEAGLTARRADGGEEHHEAATVLWTAGVAAPPLAQAIARACGVEQDRSGRIKVGPDLTVPGHPDISVAGDLMSVDRLPGVAEVAMQSGRYTGTRIRRAVQGHRPPGPFKYRDLGSAAYVARGRAVVTLGRVRLSGFVGWLAWLLLHIAFLTGFRNRLFAVATWLVAFTREIRPERAFTAREFETARDVYAAIKGGEAAKHAVTRLPGAGAVPRQTGEREQPGAESARATRPEGRRGVQGPPESPGPRDSGASGGS
ncbi:NAD(P)/FAD-dependent oxidoreductase [Actinopolymorpha pittospori]|uniref:NADH dehydrogenase n=1 Tax=Actinopolymorpha pittospori TaxID=648752 RepID=A0A927RFB6_9ACTN|nr:NAD(P)/FAD-dependent oxidoreductase [Actinopolymorpha pittospori]MBE1610050.1 NADH dehydrogenase [Actinopolymorpha pittospori]